MPRVLTMEDLGRSFKRNIKTLRDFRPFWPVLAVHIHNLTMFRFAVGGPGWAPLSPRTIAARKRKGMWGGGQQILIGRGTLRSSVMASIMGASADHHETMTKTRMEYGTYLSYAKYLQGDLNAWQPGASASSYSTRLPPRPFLYLISPEDTRSIEDMAARFFEARLSKDFK